MKLIILEKKGISNEEFINICNNSLSMLEAASKLNLNTSTFIKYAKHLKCYKPSQGLKIKKIPLEDVIYKGLYPNFTTVNLKRRLIRENIKEHKCEICNLTEWNNKLIPIELDHKDGNKRNNLLENLRLLCPNCHAQTDTYRGKNIILKYGKRNKIKQRSLNEFRKELNKKFIIDINNRKQLILNSNIDFSKYGWRLELSKLLNLTPQYSGTFIKNHIPEIWKICWKHN